MGLKNQIKNQTKEIRVLKKALDSSENLVEKLKEQQDKLKDENNQLCNMVNEEKNYSIKQLKHDESKARELNIELKSENQKMNNLVEQYEERLEKLVEGTQLLKNALIESKEENGRFQELQEQIEFLKENLKKSQKNQSSDLKKQQDIDQVIIENTMLKETLNQMKLRLQRAINDLKFYRNILRENNILKQPNE